MEWVGLGIFCLCVFFLFCGLFGLLFGVCLCLLGGFGCGGLGVVVVWVVVRVGV